MIDAARVAERPFMRHIATKLKRKGVIAAGTCGAHCRVDRVSASANAASEPPLHLHRSK
jgi:hypothetical protein